MERSATFHTPTTPDPFSQTDPPPTHRKKRSHSVSLSRLPFHRSSRSLTKTLHSPPAAPPSLPLPSLPFRKHHSPERLHQPSSTNNNKPSPITSRRASISHAPLLPLTTRLALYPPNISLLGPSASSTTISPSTLAQTSHRLRTSTVATASALAALTASAHAATNRLDEVYYALLARAAGLEDQVSRLAALYTDLGAGREEFLRRAEGVEGDGGAVVAAWGEAGVKGKKEGEVHGLVGRLGEARERGRKAEERLERLRERVEKWDREEERKGRSRGWWFRFWGWLGVGLVVVAGLGLVWRGVPREFKGVDEWGFGWEGDGEVGIRLGIGEGEKRKEEERGKKWMGILDEL